KPVVATAITQLCCYQGRLPIGAPTSGIISNMVCGPMDALIMRHAKRHGVRYTRYADDITLSTNNPEALRAATGVSLEGRIQSHSIEDIGIGFRVIFLSTGCSLNPKKVRIASKMVRQSVTGVVVNRKPNVPHEF